ncbi:MAG TPA: glycerate kinase [Steroidobacteraceae bacterium]|nr:glycerate kinase [Steroidobacteraceae bacterium]
MQHPLLIALFDAAVRAARGDELPLANSILDVPLPRPGTGRVLVTGAGKAAASLARGLEAVLGDHIDSGAVLVKHGHGQQLQRIRVLEGGHPVPDAAGLAGTQQLMALVEGATGNDTMFFVLTGGASALLVEPAPGLSLADLQAANRLLVNGGAEIDEINAVRKHLSAVTGGRLRQRARCAAFCTLAISDVIGDPPAAIGSGPTVADPSTFEQCVAIVDRYRLRGALPRAVIDHLQRGAAGEIEETPKDTSAIFRDSPYRIVASNRISLDAAARVAREQGCRVEILTTEMQGHTHDAAHRFAATLRRIASAGTGDAPVVLLAGGETTLAVEGDGRGGRNQEFALVAALDLQGMRNVAVLSAGSDGTDGPTDAAGALVDGATIARGLALGLDPHDALRRHDSYPLLDAVGALHRTGPTGTNVMDLVIGVCYLSPP